MATEEKNILTTPIGRVSWPFLFGEGDPKEEGVCKYKMALMLPKVEDPLKDLGLNPKVIRQHMKAIDDFKGLLEETAQKLAEAKFGKSWKSCRWNPMLDGDEKDWEGNHGFYLLRMKTQFKPKIVRPKREDGYIEDGNDDERTGFYPGCWARSQINLYTYQASGNKGVAIGLVGVQKAWNDEVFEQSTGKTFENDIVDLCDDDDKDDLE